MYNCSCKRNSKLYVQAWCGFFHETIAYLKGNSKIKEKCFKKVLTQKIRKTCFLAPKLGVDLYTGSTYTRVNTVTMLGYLSLDIICQIMSADKYLSIFLHQMKAIVGTKS